MYGSYKKAKLNFRNQLNYSQLKRMEQEREYKPEEATGKQLSELTSN